MTRGATVVRVILLAVGLGLLVGILVNIIIFIVVCGGKPYC